MKAQITDNNWSFRDILTFLNKQCDILVPDWKKLQTWRNCLPQGSTYLEFTQWWLTWHRLGLECDLRDQVWVHQFNCCMNHRSLVSPLLKEIIELEWCEGTEWPLHRRKTFVENKLMIQFKAQQTMCEVKPPGPHVASSTSITCDSCGKPG